MSDGDGYWIAVNRWWKERADPDYDTDAVDEVAETWNANVTGVSTDSKSPNHVRITIPDVENDGERVDYTLDISEELLREAVDVLDLLDGE